jgi:two-component system, chemotaxis family, response regulator Rcp1
MSVSKIFEILLVEDNAGDVRLTQEALSHSKIPSRLNYVVDGEQAISYLTKNGVFKDSTKPDLIILDLNLPKIDGREVLGKIKNNPDLSMIPVVVLTTSSAEQDIKQSYALHANCFITKPLNYDSFDKIVRQIEQFWFETVALPH